MTELRIVNPVAEAQAASANAKRFPPASRLASLEGRTIGLYWNAKAGGEVALARTRENLQRLYPSTRFVDYFGIEGTHMRRASPEQVDRIAAECDAVIGATAD
ncbi:MAG: hypothetical protein V3V35_02150 [Dehalococcoidia bacterium]